MSESVFYVELTPAAFRPDFAEAPIVPHHAWWGLGSCTMT